MTAGLGKTTIPYLTRLWHPTTGCNGPVGPDGRQHRCPRCWAERLVCDRLAEQMRGLPEGDPFAPAFHRDRLEAPLRARRPQVIGAGFFGDWCDPAITDDQIRRVYDVVWHANNMRLGHAFIMLTKQARRLASLDFYRLPLSWPENAWLGVSITNQADADERIPHLLLTPAVHRWVSLEPMVEDVYLDLPLVTPGCPSIDAVILGGESGPGARPLDLDWVRAVRDQCAAAGVPFAYKQGSGIRPQQRPMLDGEMCWSIPWLRAEGGQR